MNDPQIRRAFHKLFLFQEHNEHSTLVIDEMGVQHGKFRADIAVINGHIDGYEIKSEEDSLYRLRNQIEGYNNIFDHISIVLTERHLDDALDIIPEWWGVILTKSNEDGNCQFQILRSQLYNETVSDYAVAQLLWRKEVQEILLNIGIPAKYLKEKRSNLYYYLINCMNSHDLRSVVRNYLKNRKNWRYPELPIPNGD